MAGAFRAFLMIDNYVYDFILQESNWKLDEEDNSQDIQEMEGQFSEEDYPHLIEVMGYFLSPGSEAKLLLDREFNHGLERILDVLEAERE